MSDPNTYRGSHFQDIHGNVHKKSPKYGDRFIHARFLTDDARPPYDDETSYAVHVVTSVKAYQDVVTVFHTTAQAWDRGNHRGQWFFSMYRESESVRRWL